MLSRRWKVRSYNNGRPWLTFPNKQPPLYWFIWACRNINDMDLTDSPCSSTCTISLTSIAIDHVIFFRRIGRERKELPITLAFRHTRRMSTQVQQSPVREHHINCLTDKRDDLIYWGPYTYYQYIGVCCLFVVYYPDSPRTKSCVWKRLHFKYVSRKDTYW